MRHCLITLLLLWFVARHGHSAQKDSVLHLDRQQWRELSEGKDYTERYKEIEPEKPEEKTTAPASVHAFDLGAFKYIFYVAVFALIVFLTARVFGNFKNNDEVKEKVVNIQTIEEIEENMHEINLEDLLKKALLAKNYRLALRLNFLMVIKLLSQKELIGWAKEKTNWEYYSELRDKLLADQFKELILSFETFWYGEHPLTEQQYGLTEPFYLAMQKRLTPNE